MKNRTIRTLAVSAAAVTALGVTGVSPVSAKAGDIVQRGDCSARTDYQFKVQPRGSTFEFEFEVDSNRNGQAWRVRIADNGTVVFKGTRRTVAPSGSFSVSGRTADLAGTDRFVARATNLATGETCIARISA